MYWLYALRHQAPPLPAGPFVNAIPGDEPGPREEGSRDDWTHWAAVAKGQDYSGIIDTGVDDEGSVEMSSVEMSSGDMSSWEGSGDTSVEEETSDDDPGVEEPEDASLEATSQYERETEARPRPWRGALPTTALQLAPMEDESSVSSLTVSELQGLQPVADAVMQVLRKLEAVMGDVAGDHRALLESS